MTKGKRRTGRPPKTPAKQSVRRAFIGEKDGSPHAGNSAMTNGEIRRTAKFRAYSRMVRLAEEIDEELALAVADNPQNPDKIHCFSIHKSCRKKHRVFSGGDRRTSDRFSVHHSNRASVQKCEGGRDWADVGSQAHLENRARRD
jgi:hypothetical protein